MSLVERGLLYSVPTTEGPLSEAPLYYDKDAHTSGKISAMVGKLEESCG